jgi:GNAT superfamily N-acetyltransferase
MRALARNGATRYAAPMAKKSTPLRIRELTEAELPRLFRLIHLHNPGISQAMFTTRLKAMVARGYRAIGVFDGETLAACSGFWLRSRFWSGAELDLDNFIVHPDYRRRRLGAQMLAWFEKLAAREHLDLIVLDTYADAFLAHRFYMREGFVMTGYHMTKRPGTREPFTKIKKK